MIVGGSRATPVWWNDEKHTGKSLKMHVCVKMNVE